MEFQQRDHRHRLHRNPYRGTGIITGSEDRTVLVWNAENDEEVHTIQASNAPIVGIAFTPDHKRIFTCGEHTIARVWDAERGQEGLTLATSLYGIGAFSPNGKRMLTSSCFLWETETGKFLQKLPADEEVKSTFSPDGRRILGCVHSRKDVTIWDSESGKVLLNIPNSRGEAAFSPDGEQVVAGSADADFAAKVWSSRTGDEVLVLKGHTLPVTFAAFSADGKHILTGAYKDDRGETRLWNAKTGQELLTIKNSKDQFIEGAEFSPRGERILVYGFHGCRIWDIKTGKCVLTIEDAYGPASFSPDGKCILTETGGGIAEWGLKVWNAETGNLLLTPRVGPALVTIWGWTPDGKQVFTGTYDGLVKLWKVKVPAD